MANNLLEEIQQKLRDASLQKTLESHKRFVPDLDLTTAYGVPMPVLNLLAQQYRQGGFELVDALWSAGAVEEKILAAKMLGKIAGKDPAKALALVEHFSAEITNWAICDAIGMQSLKPLVKKYSKEIFALAHKLNHSKDLWQRRLSLVMVEWYTRDQQYHAEINKLVANLENDKEYYVKKAIVWLKRNLEKGK